MWKIMIGAMALMWGTAEECAVYQREIKKQGGECCVEKCTQTDIDAICRRGWM